MTSLPLASTQLTFARPSSSTEIEFFGSPSRKILHPTGIDLWTAAALMLWLTESGSPSKSSGVIADGLVGFVSATVNLRDEKVRAKSREAGDANLSEAVVS